jgi:hypothetical protein
MANEKNVDNPFGRPRRLDVTKLTPEEVDELWRNSTVDRDYYMDKDLPVPSDKGSPDIDDPFEGKKLENIDEPEWGKKSKGIAKKATEKGVATTKTTPSMAQKVAEMQRAASKGGRTLRKALTKAPGILGPAVSRAAGPAGATIVAHDIYTGVQDPDFIRGMTRLLGGEEAAYNLWAEEEAKEGRERPSYEEQLQTHQAMMEEEGGLPDTREVAKRALAPRHSQELPADTE